MNCPAVENEVADNRYQRSALDDLIYNAPLVYADLVLNADSETCLEEVAEYTPLGLTSDWRSVVISYCVWEHNGNDTLLYATNFVGAYTRGEGLEIAKAKMPQEIASYPDKGAAAIVKRKTFYGQVPRIPTPFG